MNNFYEQDNKVMQMAATAYILKKLMKFGKRDNQTLAMEARASFLAFFDLVRTFFRYFEPLIF